MNVINNFFISLLSNCCNSKPSERHHGIWEQLCKQKIRSIQNRYNFRQFLNFRFFKICNYSSCKTWNFVLKLQDTAACHYLRNIQMPITRLGIENLGNRDYKFFRHNYSFQKFEIHSCVVLYFLGP